MTLVLAADDGFRIHETLFASVLGWDEKVAFGIYGLMMADYLLGFRREILGSPYPY